MSAPAATPGRWNTKGVTAGAFLLCFVVVGVMGVVVAGAGALAGWLAARLLR